MIVGFKKKSMTIMKDIEVERPEKIIERWRLDGWDLTL